MQSLNINPKPVIHTDEDGKKKIKEWKLIMQRNKLFQETRCVAFRHAVKDCIPF